MVDEIAKRGGADILAADELQPIQALLARQRERTVVGAPWRFDAASEVGYDTWSPELGQHNEEVICGLLGHSREDLARWIEDGAVL